MSKENLFSTKREEKLTGSQMLENVIKRRENQRRNMMALTEARRLSESVQDFTPTFESTNLEVEEDIKKNNVLESLYFNQGSKNIAKQQLQLRSRLMTEGLDYTKRKVLEEIIYESYWLDDPVKESTVDQVEESISKVLEYVDTNLSNAKSTTESKFISNMNKVIEEVVKEAVDRIVAEAESSNDVFAEFELNGIEDDKLEEKLTDLGKDELVDVIKSKVAQVIQDEKEKGKEKAEMFDEIEKSTSEEPEENTDEETSEDESDNDDVKESMGYDSSNMGRMVYEGLFNKKKKDKKSKKKEDKPEKKPLIKKSVKEALMTNDGFSYNASEKYMIHLLENDVSTDVFVDPSWGDFKSYVSMMSKKIQGSILTKDYCSSLTLIDDLDNRLSSVPETIPNNVKEFVLTMTNVIYGAIPDGEIIISRLGGMGSPDMINNVDLLSTSWTDVLVNIKTNLSSVRDYCNNACQVSTEPVSDCSIVEDKPTLESMILLNKTRKMNKNIGNSLFEALMIGNMNETIKVVSESNMDNTDEEIDDAALIESLLQYTVLETLDTLGIYKFRLSDINKIKHDFVRSVTEGNTPIYGTSDKDTVGVGKDKKGRKAVRINTKKMKRKSKLFVGKK